MITRYLDLQRGWMAVNATEAVLVDTFAGVLGGPVQERALATPCFTLDIGFGTPETPPANAVLLHQGPVLDEGEALALSAGGDLLQIFPQKASLRISTDHARLVVTPDELPRVRMTLGMLALEHAIRASGQIPLHAAGLTLPDGEMIVVIGRSGAGKSTAALALCGAGFGLCSDDLLFVRTATDGVFAWGLPRSLKVHRHTTALLPWSAPLLTGTWSDAGERPLPLSKLRSVSRVEDMTPRRVAAIYLLQRSTAHSSTVSSIPHAEVFAAAAADHMRTTVAGVLPEHARHFSSLADVFRRLPSFRLVVGAKPADLGSTVIAHHQTMVNA